MGNKINIVIGENIKSKIIVTDKSVRVSPKVKSNAYITPNIVTLTPGIQAELGRSLKEFIECVQHTDKPLLFTLISGKRRDGVRIYNLNRMETGKVKEAYICSIVSIDDIMISFQFNQELAYDENYRRYEKLSILHQLTLGKSTHSDLLFRGSNTISKITGIHPNSLMSKPFKDGLDVILLDEGIKYTFFKDSHGFMNLLSITKGKWALLWRV